MQYFKPCAFVCLVDVPLSLWRLLLLEHPPGTDCNAFSWTYNAHTNHNTIRISTGILLRTSKIAFIFTQALKWVNQTVKDKQMIAAAKLKAQQKKDAQQANSGGGGGAGRSSSKNLEPIEPAFTVAPQVNNPDIPTCARYLFPLAVKLDAKFDFSEVAISAENI